MSKPNEWTETVTEVLEENVEVTPLAIRIAIDQTRFPPEFPLVTIFMSLATELTHKLSQGDIISDTNQKLRLMFWIENVYLSSVQNETATLNFVIDNPELAARIIERHIESFDHLSVIAKVFDYTKRELVRDYRGKMDA